MDILVAFESTHAAMAAQKALKSLTWAVVPTPREITASCGMSLKVTRSSEGEIKELLDKAFVQDALYSLYNIPTSGKYIPIS